MKTGGVGIILTCVGVSASTHSDHYSCSQSMMYSKLIRGQHRAYLHDQPASKPASVSGALSTSALPRPERETERDWERKTEASSNISFSSLCVYSQPSWPARPSRKLSRFPVHKPHFRQMDGTAPNHTAWPRGFDPKGRPCLFYLKCHGDKLFNIFQNSVVYLYIVEWYWSCCCCFPPKSRGCLYFAQSGA